MPNAESIEELASMAIIETWKNSDRLMNCQRHVFWYRKGKNDYECQYCGGIVDPMSVRFYGQGLQHGIKTAGANVAAGTQKEQ